MRWADWVILALLCSVLADTAHLRGRLFGSLLWSALAVAAAVFGWKWSRKE